MIGVISRDTERWAVREFFELFKTPWEFFVPDHKYAAVIATSHDVPTDASPVVLVVYDSGGLNGDVQPGITPEARKKMQWVVCDAVEFPIYGEARSPRGGGKPFAWCKETSEVLGCQASTGTHSVVRLGYDLFQEVSILLTQGQPAANAHIPTLELHIALLRSILLAQGLAFVEIPPVPAGYEYMACLTHDVDFTGIREHKLDRTIWGFVYRASVASIFDAIRGRMAWSKCRKNWGALLSLPFVHIGWKDDFWLEFDRYMEIEKGLGSTFFFIPFKNCAGMRGTDPAPKLRAAKYDLTGISKYVHKLIEQKCEIGLHGIDAWQSSTKAQTEAERINGVASGFPVGVRMHWLYFSEESPKALEEAGLSYDSTFGYNDGVGFRAGTGQAFRPKGVKELLELPLSVQDTALFYAGRMHLSEDEAMDVCKQLMESMGLFGGALVVNWHTRSLSPERLWDGFYRDLLNQIRQRRVWFGTAQQIVSWFQKRRAVRFDEVGITEEVVRVKMSGPSASAEPPLLLRVHYPNTRSSARLSAATPGHFRMDVPWSGEIELNLVRATVPSDSDGAGSQSCFLSHESSAVSFI